jgi:hypothetical protein
MLNVSGTALLVAELPPVAATADGRPPPIMKRTA